MRVNILGTEYEISGKTKEEDPFLEKCDGYCDKSSRKIVVLSKDEGSEFEDFEWYRKKVLRHELIHAFLYESGLHENWTHPQYGHDETYVDWIAVQFDKVLKVFKEAGAID